MYLGIDIGGTTARVSSFCGLDETSELGRIEFAVTKDPNGNFEQDFDNLVRACRELATRYGSIEGVGLVLAGKVNATRSSLTAASSLSHWAGQPVVFRLSKALNCRVALGNDAEAAGLAEAYYGYGQNSDFWLIIWGTGIGGCLVRYLNGIAEPLPGEPGHQRVNLDSNVRCKCGQYGCIETYCGGAGIAERFNTPAENLATVQWLEVIS